MLDTVVKTIEMVRSIHDWRTRVEKHATDERTQPRLLYLECLHNVEVIEALRIDGAGWLPSNHSGFLHVAAALRIDAH